MIKGLISQLPADQIETCDELCNHIKRVIREAGKPLGGLAIALVGAEMQLENSK